MRLSVRPILGASFPQQHRELIDAGNQPPAPRLIVRGGCVEQLSDRSGQTVGVHGALWRRVDEQALPRTGPIVLPRLVELVGACQCTLIRPDFWSSKIIFTRCTMSTKQKMTAKRGQCSSPVHPQQKTASVHQISS